MGVFIASFLLLRIADKLTPHALSVSRGFCVGLVFTKNNLSQYMYHALC